MAIRFFLKAEKKLDGELTFREFYDFAGRVGHVDQDIAKQHKVSHAAWEEHLRANGEKLRAAAKAHLEGKLEQLPIFPPKAGQLPIEPEPEPKPVPPVEPTPVPIEEAAPTEEETPSK